MTDHASPFFDPALVVALALATGMVAQSLARHLRIPGILLLLGAGVVLGPDSAGVIQPDTLGDALPALIGFAVAVILFEGGLNLNLARLRREGKAIRQLVTVGALVTTAAGALAARLGMGWEWSQSLLFGTLIIVTGPTVIGPLLRRVRVRRSVATVLEAEGVLIDAVGAITAAVALEIALHPSSGSFLEGALEMGERLGLGLGLGLVGGFGLALLLRWRRVVPEGLENVLTLSLVLVLFQVSNAIAHESGIAAVTVAGMVVGNMRTHVQRDLLEFKEQLTVLFIGMLFVLLAADVRLEQVWALGWGGVVTVLAVVFAVRPTNVFIGTLRSDLGLREKLFIAWIGPRGIVAAAVASLFASKMDAAGYPGGTELRALVFLVIATTVVSAGLTGSWVARRLGLERPSDRGWVILGANELARVVAKILGGGGEEIVCVDTSHDAVARAESEDLRVIYGNGLEERTLQRAEIETRAGAIALSPNDEVNLLFVQAVRREAHLKQYLLARGESPSVTDGMVESAGAELLFGRRSDTVLWSLRLRRGHTTIEEWELVPEPSGIDDVDPTGALKGPTLALVRERDERRTPVSDRTRFQAGDRVWFLLYTEEALRARTALTEAGWQPAKPRT